MKVEEKSNKMCYFCGKIYSFGYDPHCSNSCRVKHNNKIKSDKAEIISRKISEYIGKSFELLLIISIILFPFVVIWDIFSIINYFLRMNK